MPKTAVSSDVIQDAVESACRAPSIHNSQPWRWVVDRAGVQLFLDPDRMVDTDRSGREALISCGAALDHFRVSMAAAGWTASVTRCPDPADANHLAAIDFAPLAAITDTHRLRAAAIRRRRTDRLPFDRPCNWDAFVPVLRRTMEDGEPGRGEIVRLDLVADDARSQLVQASQLTDAVRMYDSAYHAELDWWTAPFSTSDGIPPDSLLSAAESDRVDVGRNFPVGEHQDRRVEVGEDRSKIVVLSTVDEAPESVLGCGEALSAMLLECTAAGMATCTLTHITEVAASREMISALIAQPFPQVLVRIGLAANIAEQPARTPRRPVADVLQFAP